MQIKLTLSRIGKPPREYHEGFIEDNGVCLRTLSIVPEEHRAAWSQKWQTAGVIQSEQIIATARKTLFYQEYFGIMELRGLQDELLGYYIDICTPLEKTGAEYVYTDLILDLYIFPDGRYKILDKNEFNEAVQGGMITPELACKARATLERLVRETENGEFPIQYI